jgi:hypothetical protein
VEVFEYVDVAEAEELKGEDLGGGEELEGR